MNLQLNHIWLSSKIERGRAPRAVSAPVVKMPKRQLYFAPIDLVEDRTRTRVVGVGVMMEVTSGGGCCFVWPRAALQMRTYTGTRGEEKG